MKKNLSADELGDLLEQPVLAILATRRKDDSTLLSPVWFEWDDEGISVVIWADDIKSRHLKRDPRATILVAESNPPYRGIEIRGEASVSSPDDVMPKVRRMAIRYMGEEAGNTYADSFVGHALEEVRIRSGNIRSWDFSDDLD